MKVKSESGLAVNRLVVFASAVGGRRGHRPGGGSPTLSERPFGRGVVHHCALFDRRRLCRDAFLARPQSQHDQACSPHIGPDNCGLDRKLLGERRRRRREYNRRRPCHLLIDAGARCRATPAGAGGARLHVPRSADFENGTLDLGIFGLVGPAKVLPALLNLMRDKRTPGPRSR